MKWVTGLSVTCLIAAGSLSASAGGASTTTTPSDVTTKLDWTKPEITTYPASPTLWRRYPSAGSAMVRACSGSGKNCCITFSLSDCYSGVFPPHEFTNMPLALHVSVAPLCPLLWNAIRSEVSERTSRPPSCVHHLQDRVGIQPRRLERRTDSPVVKDEHPVADRG